ALVPCTSPPYFPTGRAAPAANGRPYTPGTNSRKYSSPPSRRGRSNTTDLAQSLSSLGYISLIPGSEKESHVKRLTILSVASAFFAALLPLLAQQPPATPPAAPGPGPAAGAPAAAARGRGPAYQLTPADRQEIQTKLDQLDALIKPLKAKRGEDDLMADVDVHSKAAHWVLEFPEDVTAQNDVRNVLAVLDRGLERAKQLQAGQSPWTSQK